MDARDSPKSAGERMSRGWKKPGVNRSLYMGHALALISFRPERVLFRPGGVNLRAHLCGVLKYASAQPLHFLARTKNPSFPDRKLTVSHPVFPDGHFLILYPVNPV